MTTAACRDCGAPVDVKPPLGSIYGFCGACGLIGTPLRLRASSRRVAAELGEGRDAPDYRTPRTAGPLALEVWDRVPEASFAERAAIHRGAGCFVWMLAFAAGLAVGGGCFALGVTYASLGVLLAIGPLVGILIAASPILLLATQSRTRELERRIIEAAAARLALVKAKATRVRVVDGELRVIRPEAGKPSDAWPEERVSMADVRAFRVRVDLGRIERGESRRFVVEAARATDTSVLLEVDEFAVAAEVCQELSRSLPE